MTKIWFKTLGKICLKDFTQLNPAKRDLPKADI